MRRICVIAILCVVGGCGGATFVAGGGDGGAGDATGSSSGSSSSGGSGSSSGSSTSSSGGSSSSSGSSSGGPDGGRVPVFHRPDDHECSTTPDKGTCNIGGGSSGGPGQCANDSQCTSGTNGRCVYSTGGAVFCLCTYDTCVHDAECTGNVVTVCACHGSPYTGGAGNTCKPGNCRVDSDCGAGGYCSPSATGTCGSLGGYYCHTPADTCIDDSDCKGAGGPANCTYSTTSGHWACTPSPLCG